MIEGLMVSRLFIHIPLVIVTAPIIGAFLLIAISQYRDKWRDPLIIATTTFVLLLSIVLALGAWAEPLASSYSSGLGDYSLNFRIDRFAATINLLAAFIWFLASIYSLSYMNHEKHLIRYYFFYLLTLSGCLGVFLTADLFSLFIFFELMSLASYLLVIHTQTKEAMSSGKLYLFLGVFGGLCLLTAILLINSFTGSVYINPSLENLLQIPGSYFVAGLLIIGFGIKAGMIPLHIWLPKAHPVAPSPASALLSGIMIKTGAYGIFRVVNNMYVPINPEGKTLWEITANFGYIIIWFGIMTMFIAAMIALFQSNAKRILAYSSISQMGYILMGIGACAYLGLDGPVAMGGLTLHIINHAFFKAGMFMMVGAVYYRTGELDLNKLGGLWKEFPVTAIAFLLAAMGLAGIPGLNGYTSKVLLHHAIVEAYEHHHIYGLYIAERIFMLTGVLTTCYIARLFGGVFLGKRTEFIKKAGKEPLNEKAVFITIGLITLFIGTSPGFMMKNVILPIVSQMRFDSYQVFHLAEVHFFASHDILPMVGVVFLAFLIFYLGNRYHWFNRELPGILSIENNLYQPIVSLVTKIYLMSGRTLEVVVDSLYVQSPKLLVYYCTAGNMIDYASNFLIVDSLGYLKRITTCFKNFENQNLFFNRLRLAGIQLLEYLYYGWLLLLALLYYHTRRITLIVFNFLFQLDYKHRGRFFVIVNTANFEYYLIIFFITLIIIMSLQLFR